MTSTIAHESETAIVRNGQSTWLVVVLTCVVLTSVAVLPFFFIGEDQKVGCCGGEMPITHDAWMHYNQMNAFWRGLSAGIVYPRWDEHTHGYGAPTTSFYPPGAYYLASAIYFVARDWVLAWAGFYWLAMLASAAAIYGYARRYLSRGSSLLAMAIYVFAPYHLLNQYQRGAMAEFASFIWIPLCLLFAEKLLREDAGTSNRTLDAVGLAASFGAFLWTHPPTAYQFVLVFGSCLVVQGIRQGKWRELGWIVVSLIFGSMLAAAYFLPAIVEQRLVNYDDVERTWPYHASYVFDFSQKVYDHIGNPFFVRLDRIWAFTTVAILLGTIAVVVTRKGNSDRANASSRSAIQLWAVAGLLASFLMTKYSAPLGRFVPKIELGVFSWRMLALTSFALAMLVAAIADCGLRMAAWRKITAAITLAGVLAMSGWYVVWPIWRGQSFEPKPEHYNYATLPRGASRDNPPMPPVQLASGKDQINIERWTPEFRQLRVELNDADQLQFRTRNFAGWTVTVDGQIAPIQEGVVKNILVGLPAGTHRITLEFRSTPIRRMGNWLTVLSFISLLAIIVIKRRK